MPREFPRSRRVGEQMQRELAELIRDEVKDPRVGMVTIAAVEVSKDLAHAKVWFTVLGAEPTVTAEGLNRASGFLRRELGRRMVLRSVPQLHFVYDDSVVRGNELASLIDRAVSADRHDEEDETPDTPGTER
ncbi:30S ribosome-binding factor RbfA [Endothiovibrio diazotrophicus]